MRKKESGTGRSKPRLYSAATREPLLLAAQNFHSRLYTLVKNNILATYLHSGDPGMEQYARDYTVYVVAEYLCWAEIIRRNLRFLDLGAEERNRELVRQLECVQLAIADHDLPRAFRHPLLRSRNAMARLAWSSGALLMRQVRYSVRSLSWMPSARSRPIPAALADRCHCRRQRSARPIAGHVSRRARPPGRLRPAPGACC